MKGYFGRASYRLEKILAFDFLSKYVGKCIPMTPGEANLAVNI